MTGTFTYCSKLFLALLLGGLITGSGCAETRQARIGDGATTKSVAAVSPATFPNPLAESENAREAGIANVGTMVERDAEKVATRADGERSVTGKRDVTDTLMEKCNSGGCGQCSR